MPARKFPSVPSIDLTKFDLSKIATKLHLRNHYRNSSLAAEDYRSGNCPDRVPSEQHPDICQRLNRQEIGNFRGITVK